MNRFPFLAQRLFNVPVAITPGKAEMIIAALADRLGVSKAFTVSGGGALVPMAWDDDWDDDDGEFGAVRSGRHAKGYDTCLGVAVIEISGTLVQKNGTLRPDCGMTGYDGIRQNFFEALADPSVKAIMLNIDSPGGEVSGCFDLADAIFQARGEKPIWAVLNECAYSAAYALASACDRITVPRTGGTGSIGVVCCHVDFSKMLSTEGIEVTFIQYGARKTDGASEKPLSDDAQQRLQADIDLLGEMFVETVARNRSVSADAVRATQAGIFLGTKGVEIGLADAVMPPDVAFHALLDLIEERETAAAIESVPEPALRHPA